MPTGRSTRLIGKKLEGVKCDGKSFLSRDSKELHGLAQVTILPPDSLFLPVLPLLSNSKLMFGLCKKCIEEKNRELCTHSDHERAITSVYTTAELIYAVKCGYKILTIHEMLVFEKYYPVFSEYYSSLAKIKIGSEALPQGITTDREKEDYVNRLNNDMPGLNLSVSDLIENSDRRSFGKSLGNISLGKFSQSTDMSDEVKLIRGYEEYLEIQQKAVTYKVKSLTPLTHTLAEVVTEPLPEFAGFARRAQCGIYAFLTSIARIILLDSMREIQRCGGRVFYCDTGITVLFYYFFIFFYFIFFCFQIVLSLHIRKIGTSRH